MAVLAYTNCQWNNWWKVSKDTLICRKALNMVDEKKPEEKEQEKKEEKKEEKPAPNDNLVVTKHTIKIGGRELKYTVTAGTMVLKEETTDREKESEGEKPRAQVFFVAYTKDGNGPTSTGNSSALRKRPITF